MGRHKEAPWNFECPYKNLCPHLGISTTWASVLLADLNNDEFRDGHARIEAEKELKELDEENRVLSARVAELEARLKQQHRSLFKANKKKHRERSDRSAERTRESSPRKRGAPKGHPPWQRRKPDHVDKTVHVPAPDVCPHCSGEGLTPRPHQTHVQIQEDIVLQPRTEVTEFVHELSYCPTCRREVFQTAERELRNCHIGPVTKATATYLRHEVKLSYRDVQKVFTGLFGMPFVPASAMRFGHQVAERGAHLYEDLRDKIRAADVAHGDETYWRIDGQGAFLWYAGNGQVAFYHADYSRSSEVATSIFGSSFSGNLVADSYAAYNAINPKRRQACLSHLIRKAEEVSDRIELMPRKMQDQRSLHFCKSLGKLFAIACRIDQRRISGTVSFSAAKRHIPRLQRVLDAICRFPLAQDDAENLRQRVSDPKRDALRLFTFLKVKDMPPTNNHAEQSLRLPVIFRKISFGSRSLLGAQATAIDLSLLTTAKRQTQNPINLFTNILLNGSKTPVTALYAPANFPGIDSS